MAVMNACTAKRSKAKAMAAAKVAQDAAAEVPEPINEADLLACIDEYNRTEVAAHALKGLIYAGLAKRKGYRMLRIG
jgi:uncharacterized alpha-E superfamily protein